MDKSIAVLLVHCIPTVKTVGYGGALKIGAIFGVV